MEIWGSTPNTTTVGVAEAMVDFHCHTGYLTAVEIVHGPALRGLTLSGHTVFSESSACPPKSQTWRVQFAFVKAKMLAPVFVPFSRRTFYLESSPLVGEIVRFFGHLCHDRGGGVRAVLALGTLA